MYCLINIALMGMAVLLRRPVFMVFGALGVAAYLGYLSYEVFAQSLLFPVVLTMIGLGVIWLGLVYQKRRENLNPGTLEHDRSRAILFRRQLHRPLDLRFFQPTPLHHKVHVNLGEHLRVFAGALRLQKCLAAFHCLARLLQNAHHVKAAAATQAQQQHFHRSHAQVAAAGLGRAVHYDDMAAPRFAEEHCLTGPLDTCLHLPGLLIFGKGCQLRPCAAVGKARDVSV